MLSRGADVVTASRIRKFSEHERPDPSCTGGIMDILIERCAGLDVHKRTVVATIRSPGPAGGRVNVTRSFGTTTAALLGLATWLADAGVTHVAMESTGVYWRPVYAVLEDRLEVRLVNPRAVKHVPGRKTDVRDSEWLAQLLECGLLQGELHPPAPDSGSAGPDAVPEGADPGAGAPREPRGKDVGVGADQAGIRGHGPDGQDGPGDPGGLDRGADRSGDPGGIGAGAIQEEDRGVTGGGDRRPPAALRVPAAPATADDRSPDAADRGP